ncbi:MAG: MBL fold metallo-hydrolase [Bacteroidales bacterium]
MKIIVLTDNHAGGRFGAEHGLSWFIESPDYKFLFDTGHSDLFLRNAEKSGINLPSEIDTVVLSHGHWDHGDGLEFIQGKKLVCHPGVFIKRFRKGGIENIGLKRTKDEYLKMFDVHMTINPIEIFNGVWFLGQIPRKTSFESKSTGFIYENGDPDYVIDDSAIALVKNNELSVISGCAHSGIVNIVQYAMEITGIKKLKLVAGGFHLKQNNQQTQKTISWFKDYKSEILLPSHCTQLPALAAFHKEFGSLQLKTGDVIDL